MIRNANPSDAIVVINLLDLAIDNVGLKLSGKSDRGQSRAVLAEFFSQKGNILSYENIDVFEIDNMVIGAICAYNSNLREKLLEPFIVNLNKIGKDAKFDKECFADEFYIDSLAVDEKFRGQGIATKLIQNSFLKATKQNLKKCSLLVNFSKPKTEKFYGNLGFVKNCKLNVAGEQYFHMIKELG